MVRCWASRSSSSVISSCSVFLAEAPFSNAWYCNRWAWVKPEHMICKLIVSRKRIAVPYHESLFIADRTDCRRAAYFELILFFDIGPVECHVVTDDQWWFQWVGFHRNHIVQFDGGFQTKFFVNQTRTTPGIPGERKLKSLPLTSMYSCDHEPMVWW